MNLLAMLAAIPMMLDAQTLAGMLVSGRTARFRLLGYVRAWLAAAARCGAGTGRLKGTTSAKEGKPLSVRPAAQLH